MIPNYVEDAIKLEVQLSIDMGQLDSRLRATRIKSREIDYERGRVFLPILNEVYIKDHEYYDDISMDEIESQDEWVERHRLVIDGSAPDPLSADVTVRAIARLATMDKYQIRHTKSEVIKALKDLPEDYRVWFEECLTKARG